MEDQDDHVRKLLRIHVQEQNMEIYSLQGQMQHLKKDNGVQMMSMVKDNDALRSRLNLLELEKQQEIDSLAESLCDFQKQSVISLNQAHLNQSNLHEDEASKLKGLIDVKNVEIENLIEQNQRNKIAFQEESDQQRSELTLLKQKLLDQERIGRDQMEQLKEDLSAYHQDNLQNVLDEKSQLIENLKLELEDEKMQNLSQYQSMKNQLDESISLQVPAKIVVQEATATNAVQTAYIETQNMVENIQKNLFITVEDIPSDQIINVSDIINDSSIIANTHNNDIDTQTKQTSILGLAQMFKQNTNMNFIVTNDKSKVSSLTQLSILSSFLSGSDQFQFNIPDQSYKFYTFNRISKKENEMNDFKLEARWHIATAFDVPPSDVIIINITQGGIIVNFVILGFNSLNQQNYLEKINQATKYLQENMKITTLDSNQMTFVLNVNDFDKRGDFTFAKGDKQTRGGCDYYQPSAPYVRIGLSVRGKFDDDEWIEMNGNSNEWAVAFHGVTDHKGFAFPKIDIEGLNEGARQAYQLDTCKRTGLIIGRGIYCTPQIEIALGYTKAINLNETNYKYIFQCRVNPSAIRDIGNDYWVVNDPKDIRPYGIFMIKC